VAVGQEGFDFLGFDEWTPTSGNKFVEEPHVRPTATRPCACGTMSCIVAQPVTSTPLCANDGSFATRVQISPSGEVHTAATLAAT
jgi:hypothetical protein